MIEIHKPKPDKNKMTLVQLFDYIDQLEAENARLEESFQRATGAVAADALPTLAEMRKISEMCKNGKCDNCPYLNKSIKKCRFVHGADYWDFGGADNA
jgi:MoaA/NifB/PqqE/SkfB family radical SAM enzyme